MKTKLSGRILTICLALIMSVSLFSFAAQAATTDPNMTAAGGNFTIVVPASSVATSHLDIELFAQPADASFTPTFFSSNANAESVVWTRVAGSATGIHLHDSTFSETVGGGIVSGQEVRINAGTQPGVASFLATNPNSVPANAAVNITVIVNGTPNDGSISVSNVTVQVFQPSTPVVLHSATFLSTAANLSTDGRSYVTALDSLKGAEGSVIETADASGGFVDAIKFFNVATPYANSGSNGWQYRVYSLNGTGRHWVSIDVSDAVGAGDMKLDNEMLVQWRFGAFDDATLFPDEFLNPNFVI